VLPDGVLTNSSLQYVRDEIEDLFRIVAVISLPQTAFSATGAGVKSSILFLKKHALEETKRIRDTKQALKDSIRQKQDFDVQLANIESKRKKALLELNNRSEFRQLSAIERKDNVAYAEAAKKISGEYTAQLEALRYRLAEIFEDRRRTVLTEYDVFMGIAEDIGYDAVGRPTKTNDLEPIAEKLSSFIVAIEEGKA
jgi:hypothetical protein